MRVLSSKSHNRSTLPKRVRQRSTVDWLMDINNEVRYWAELLDMSDERAEVLLYRHRWNGERLLRSWSWRSSVHPSSTKITTIATNVVNITPTNILNTTATNIVNITPTNILNTTATNIVNITPTNILNTTATNINTTAATNRQLCTLCLNEVDAHEMDRLACGHGFCRACWIQWCWTLYRERGPLCLGGTCPFVGTTSQGGACQEGIPSSCWIRYLSHHPPPTLSNRTDQENEQSSGQTQELDDTTNLHIWSRLIRRWQVIYYLERRSDGGHLGSAHSVCGSGAHGRSDRPTRQWTACSTAHCSQWFFPVDHSNRPMLLVCDGCHASLCGRCLAPDHVPLSCQLYQRWAFTHGTTEKADQKWIESFTQPCPHCRAPIQKIAGCPHMTCRRCDHQFCWKCLAPWSSHDNGCTSRRVKQRAHRLAKQQQSREQLARFHRFSTIARHFTAVGTRFETMVRTRTLQARLDNLARLVVELSRFLQWTTVARFYTDDHSICAVCFDLILPVCPLHSP